MGGLEVKPHEFRWVEPQCCGCARIVDGRCKAYWNPAAQWRGQRTCPLATEGTVGKPEVKAVQGRKPEGWRQRKQRGKKHK